MCVCIRVYIYILCYILYILYIIYTYYILHNIYFIYIYKIYIYVYICIYVCMCWYFGWLFSLDFRVFFSAPSLAYPMAYLTCTLYIRFHPLFLPSSPPSLLHPSLAFLSRARSRLRIRSDIAREMFNVLSISVTGIPYEHTWLIDSAYRTCIRQCAVLFFRKDIKSIIVFRVPANIE